MWLKLYTNMHELLNATALKTTLPTSPTSPYTGRGSTKETGFE